MLIEVHSHRIEFRQEPVVYPGTMVIESEDDGAFNTPMQVSGYGAIVEFGGLTPGKNYRISAISNSPNKLYAGSFAIRTVADDMQSSQLSVASMWDQSRWQGKLDDAITDLLGKPECKIWCDEGSAVGRLSIGASIPAGAEFVTWTPGEPAGGAMLGITPPQRDYDAQAAAAHSFWNTPISDGKFWVGSLPPGDGEWRTKFEYHVLKHFGAWTSEQLIEEVNALGAQGWEMVWRDAAEMWFKREADE